MSCPLISSKYLHDTGFHGFMAYGFWHSEYDLIGREIDYRLHRWLEEWVMGWEMETCRLDERWEEGGDESEFTQWIRIRIRRQE